MHALLPILLGAETPALEVSGINLPTLAAGLFFFLAPICAGLFGFVVWLVVTSWKFKATLDDKANHAEVLAAVKALEDRRNALATPYGDRLSALERDVAAKANAATIAPDLETLKSKTNAQDVVLSRVQGDVSHLAKSVDAPTAGVDETRKLVTQVLARLPT